ncbi:mucin-19 [Anopheles moucheti]|uniref:mucin-19 n=1 Tax=Anopheles moucheti TaxID=186751 RepID=UPI0022EFE8DC|nr:mucin-19 [Anopheles moucheti]
MFDRSMERERSGTRQAEARNSTMKSGPPSSSSASRNQSTPSRLSSFAGSAMGLDRTLSTPPVAESTHIGSTSFSSAWNGTSIGGQSKRRPTSPLLNNRTLFKSSGNLTGIGRVNSRVLTDAQSPGLVNRLVRYYDRSQSQTMNRSQSLSSVYNKPGQFPLVQLRKQELRYANSNASRRNGNFSMVRIAPPERSLFHTNKRSSIFRSGSLLLPTTNESASETSLFGGLGSARNGPSGGGGGDEADVENRVITPCAELEATPTRSVLDALKEISRKRINSEELDADRIKKQCQELSELDAAGSGPPSSTAAVAIGTHGMATKRTREQTTESSPSSPSELGPGLGGVGRLPSSGGEQQSQKKRLCIKNNDILSSLSSSLVTMNTPKRIMVPRAERRFNANHAASVSMSSPAIGTMPTSSSTMVGPATPEKFSNMALNTPETLRRSESPRAPNGLPSRTSSNIDHWKQPVRGASNETMDQAPTQHRVPPKITLFNRPYETAISTSTADKSGSPSARGTSRIIASDGEEDEHGEGSGKVQFVRPKEKSPNDVTLSGFGSSGFSSSRDPLKKPAPSKLTVMLKCLSGDLDDYEEEEEQQQPPQPRLSQALTQSRSGFSIGRPTVSAKDTVDAIPKELPTIVASKPASVTETDTVVTPVSTPSPPSSRTVTNGLSALINNPIKDTGLGKIAPPASKEPTTETTAAKSNEEKPPEVTVAQQSEAAKSLTFTFGSGSATLATIPSTPPQTTTSTGFTLPVKPTTTAASEQSSTVATATTFTFGTPAQTATAPSSSSPLAALSNSNLISFSPATAGKLPTPVLQFGGSPVTSSTVATTATSTGTPTFSFTGGASKTVAPVSTTTTTTSPQMASSASLPTFGAGSTFGSFKLPASLTVASSSSGLPQTNTNSTTIATTSAATVVPPAFNFGFSGAANNKPATTSATIPTFGAGPLFTSTAISAVGSSASTITPVVPVAGSGAFTFGSGNNTTNAAPVSAFTFGAAATAAQASPTATGIKSAVSSSVAPTTTFPTFGSLAGSTGQATATTASNTSGTVSNQMPSQPFMFGGVKPTPSTTANIFGATTTTTSSAPSDGSNSGGKTNLFATAASQPQPNAASSMFGSVVAGQATTAANTTTGTSIFGAAIGATGTGTTGAASSPFTFGASKAVAGSPAPTNGAPNNALSATGSIFGNAATINSPAGAPAPTGGIFSFGATKPAAAPGTTPQSIATPPQQQQQQSNAPATLSNSQVIPTFGAGTGTATNAAPFTFGAVANKTPAGTTPGSGMFGAMSNNTTGTVGGNTSNSAVPTFGAGAMNGTGPVPTFGSGSIFGNTSRPGTAIPSAQNPAAGSIFGATQTNGPQSVSNNAAAAPAPTASSGGLFTFGATNSAGSNNNNTSSGTFGATGAGVTGSTFGGFNATGGGLANGIGTTNQTTTPSKPFTFGATNSNAGGTMQQNNLNAQQQATPSAPGGFNFNLGSNAAKPFNFTGGIGSVNTNGNVSSPPMFGSPVATGGNTNPAGNNASPFTFGAMVNGGNSSTGNNTSATPGPFTFGASVGQQGPGAGGGITSPFNFSAGNVAAVAPQPQQQPGAAFNFGGNMGGQQQQQQQQQPFGMVGGVSPAFGAPPAFGGPGVVPGGGIMPTFSIGTNSTPNGPTGGQRRIKVATRRVK